MSGRAAIVGAYESPRRAAPDVHPYALHAECIRGALADAGLALGDVDGFCTAAGDWGEGGAACDILDVVDYLGIRPRYFDSTDIGGGSYIGHAGHATTAIGAGRANIVVISYAGCPKSWPLPMSFWDGLTYPAGPGQFEIPFSPTIISSYALVAQRHMEMYGTTSDELAAIAVSTRRHASRNPHARYRKPLTVQDVATSPPIATPLRKLDCCVVTDGAGAVVLAGPETARSCRKPPAWVLGHGEALSGLSLSGIPERMTTPAAVSGAAAFAMASLEPRQIQTAQIYDAFTITVLMLLEDLGFCAKGEGGAFVSGGALDAEGMIPTNTDGGGLSSNHPGRRGIFALIEAVRQLRGESPGSQVPNCKTALAQGLGGIMSAATTIILGRD